MIGLIDNFDSFTYNLVSLLESAGEEVIVCDHHTPLAHCLDLNVEAWVLGPGPGAPENSGVCRELIGHAPLLGICLGHQLIATHFGGTLSYHRPHHGVRSPIRHMGEGIFEGLPQDFLAVRYHSLLVTDVPPTLEPIAWTKEGEIMGVRHRSLPIWGVQFHPDSVATEFGEELMRNFILQSRCLDSTLLPTGCG